MAGTVRDAQRASRRSTHLLRAGAIGLAALGGVSLTLATGVASADQAPTPRKIAGNVTTCKQAGLTGSILFGTEQANPAAGKGTVYDDGRKLDVTINAGYTASGVVVKGGPDAHVYDGPFGGPTTVTGMVSPRNRGGNIPQISHWFVCGEKSKTTPSATPSSKPPTTPPTMAPSTTAPTTTAPTATPTTAPTVSPTASAPHTVTPPAPPSGDLPSTGTRIGLYAASAAALMGSGALLVALIRRRPRRFEA